VRPPSPREPTTCGTLSCRFFFLAFLVLTDDDDDDDDRDASEVGPRDRNLSRSVGGSHVDRRRREECQA